GLGEWSVTGVQTCALPICSARCTPEPRGVVIGKKKGPTSASKTDPPGFRGTPGRATCAAGPVLLLLFLGGLVVTVSPPGETESRSEERRVGRGGGCRCAQG